MTMSNVISIPNVAKTDSKPATTDLPDETVKNNGFFPDLTLADVRNTMRIDGTVTQERLKHALIEAIYTVNQDLQPLRKQSDKATLAEIECEQINGENVLIYNYKRAVFCLTAANLYERYRSFDSTKSGAEKAEDLLDTAGDLRRDYHFAVRDMLGGNRMISELL